MRGRRDMLAPDRWDGMPYVAGCRHIRQVSDPRCPLRSRFGLDSLRTSLGAHRIVRLADRRAVHTARHDQPRHAPEPARVRARPRLGVSRGPQHHLRRGGPQGGRRPPDRRGLRAVHRAAEGGPRGPRDARQRADPRERRGPRAHRAHRRAGALLRTRCCARAATTWASTCGAVREGMECGREDRVTSPASPSAAYRAI